MRRANPHRGEASFVVGGETLLLRPSFQALVAAEEELGPLFALVERAADGKLSLREIVALFDHASAERPKAICPDLQYIAGVEWQHRRHAAEQHREQVEGDRAEYQPVAADIGKAVDHLLQRTPRLQRGPRQRADGEKAKGRESEQRRAERIGQVWRHVIEYAAECRAGDRAGLPGG